MFPARLSLILAAMIFAVQSAEAEILIGAAGPFSGQNAALGEQLRRGVQLAVDEINGAGGINGERLAVRFTDDGCDPRKAIDAATGFVSAGVKAVIGHYCSGASIPASKVYEKAGIVQITPASTHPRYTDEGGWNVLRLVPRDDAQADAAANVVTRHFAGRKIAILNDQSPSAISLAARFRSAMNSRGVTPVLDESYKPGARNYDALAQKLRNSGVELLYLAGSYVEGALIIRELRDIGGSAQLISGDSLVTEDFWNAAKEAAEGTLMTFTYDPRKFDSARTAVEKFRATDFNAEGFTLYAYAAVEAYAAAVVATGGSDSTRIAQWLRGGNRINTVAGDVSFDPKGDLKSPKVTLFQWRDGRYIEVDPETLEPPVLNSTP